MGGSTASAGELSILSLPSSLCPMSDHNIGWRPLTLHLYVHLLLIGTSALVIVFLGLLQDINHRTGGIFFADSDDNFSDSVTFTYNYAPTIVAVLYSTAWAWVDLDFKRLEPWFQLSQPRGASAESSLLLKYPAEFLALVPVTAAKRK